MGLTARIVARTPLLYSAGPDAALDRPAHVRAGSALAYVPTPRGPRLVVAQDDAHFLAIISVDTLGIPVAVEALTLPAGPDGARTFDDLPGGRRNKQHKLDLEAMVLFDERARPLVAAFGSGSSPARERVVLLDPNHEQPSVRVVEVPAFYAAVRAHPLLADAELNIEGAALVGPRTLRFFQRGNGTGGVDATFDIDAQGLRAHLEEGAPLPPWTSAHRWELGEVQGVRLTFTDACALDERILVVAAAEASPNAYDDGEVVGCALGILGEPLAPIIDEQGAPFLGKPEGLAVDPAVPGRAWLVVDADDPHTPSTLLTIALQDVDSVPGDLKYTAGS